MAEPVNSGPDRPPRERPRRPRSPWELPRQRRGITPQLHGRYPDYDVMDEAAHWDEVTRQVVTDRVTKPPPIRFFSPEQARTLGALCDVVMAQDAEPRIPVFAMVDAKMHDGKLDGFQYDNMPDDRETWRRVAAGLDEEARRRGAESFADADGPLRHEIVGDFAEGKLSEGIWNELPSTRAWSVITRGIVSEFYSHPWSWNEIGFGGPAYPRGYSRLGIDQHEEWEGEEALHPDPVVDTGDPGGS